MFKSRYSIALILGCFLYGYHAHSGVGSVCWSVAKGSAKTCYHVGQLSWRYPRTSLGLVALLYLASKSSVRRIVGRALGARDNATPGTYDALIQGA
jgi:hypothetical protein